MSPVRPLPGMTVAASAALVTGLLWWGTADQVRGDPDTAATDLVPPDGHRVVADADGAIEVTEHARLTGPEAVLGSPPLVGGALTSTLDGDPFRWRMWRSVTTSYDGEAGESEQTEQVTTVRRLTEDGIEQVAAYGPVALAFDPPMLEIPADVADGSTWSSSGSVLLAEGLEGIEYRAEQEAETSGDGCLRVTGSMTFTLAGETLLDNPIDERWCRDRGVVPEETAEPPGFEGDTDLLEPEAGDIHDWEEHEHPLVLASSLASAGETAGPASISVDLPPVATADGGLVVANGQGRDVLGFADVDGTYVRAWVAHPGGGITTLAAAVEVTVVGTTRRRVVGYGPRGEWLWTHRLDDVPSAPTAVADGEHVIVTSASGEVVALDPATGEEQWRSSVSDRVRVAPVTDGDVVVVADVAGALAAYDVDDGRELWTAELPDALATTVAGDVLVVRTSDAAQALDIDDGERLWSSRVPSGLVAAAVTAVGDTVAVSSEDDTIGLAAADGRELWRAPGGRLAVAVDDRLVLLSEDTLEVYAEDGERLRGWTIGALRGTVSLLAPGPNGVIVQDGIGTTVEVGS